MPLGPTPTTVPTRRGALAAVELAAAPAWERWLGERREGLAALALRGTYLDREDVNRLFALPLPGVDELVGLLELARLARAEARDEVVVDTAPTAHTLRLLAMPEALRRFAGLLAAMQRKHRAVAEQLAGAWRPDAADALPAGIEAEAVLLGGLLHDPRRARFHWVLLPEALSLAETRDALAELAAGGVPVDESVELVVNRVTPPPPEACGTCEARRMEEARVVQELEEAFPRLPVRFVAAAEREPRGRAALLRLAAAPLARTSRHVIPNAARDLGGGPDLPPWLDRLAPPGTRLLLFAGKGGVGKTTCAAAAALLLAERDPARPVLLLSTDPAHSLADVLDVPLDDSERQVPAAPAHLRARELDAPARYRLWRERLRRGLAELLGAEERGAAGAGLALDRAVVEGLLEVDPPGLDELVAILDLADLAEGDGERLVVLDTAPTGHALRLLEMPALALAWDHALLAILLKYREVLGLGELAAELVELARGLKRLQAVLADPARTRCVAVARAAELPRRETGRLLAALAGLGVAAPVVLVNALTPPGCSRCRRAAAAERRQLAALRRELPAGAAMIRAPAAFPPPRGAAPLAAWGRSWSWSESTP